VYFLALAEEAEPELVGARPMAWLERLELERGNLRAKLSWALDEESGDERVEMGLRLANALARFWDTQGPGEGRRWLERGLARGADVPSPVRAKALKEAGLVAVYEGNPRSIPMLTEALDLYKEIGDQPSMLSTIDNLGHALTHHADPEKAAAVKAEVEALLAGSGDRNVAAHLAYFLGFAAAAEKDFEVMILRLEEALALYRELGDIRNVALCLPSLGIVTLVDRGFEEAERLFEEGLAMERSIKYKTAIFFNLMGLSAVATHRDHMHRAAKLYGASEALQEATGLSPKSLANARYDYEGYLATVRAGLAEPDFDAAWSEGQAMSPEQAIEYALSAEDTSPRAVPEPSAVPAIPLTRREKEVAFLMAQGLTNRRIAQQLTLSEHTVENHVAHILKKLNLHSREEISSRHTQHYSGIHKY
jgi:DNA-binding CsgD family transcriptional regulator